MLRGENARKLDVDHRTHEQGDDRMWTGMDDGTGGGDKIGYLTRPSNSCELKSHYFVSRQ